MKGSPFIDIWEPPIFKTGNKPVMDVSIIPIKGVIPESGIAIHSPLNSVQADSSLHVVLKY